MSKLADPEDALEDKRKRAEDFVDSYLNLTPGEKKIVIGAVMRSPVAPNNTYYAEKYGHMLIGDIQEGMKNKCVIQYFYDSYPQWSENTLYQYVLNGFRYIVDYMDDENKSFAAYRDTVDIKRNRLCVYIKPKKAANFNVKGVFVSVEEFEMAQKGEKPLENLNVDWRTPLQNWMEKAGEGERYIWDKKINQAEKEELIKMFLSDELFGLDLKREIGFAVVRTN